MVAAVEPIEAEHGRGRRAGQQRRVRRVRHHRGDRPRQGARPCSRPTSSASPASPSSSCPRCARPARGRIVNIGSMGGRFTFPVGGYYHATKYAVEAITDALRNEVRAVRHPRQPRRAGPHPHRLRGDRPRLRRRCGTGHDSPYAALLAASASTPRERLRQPGARHRPGVRRQGRPQGRSSPAARARATSSPPQPAPSSPPAPSAATGSGTASSASSSRLLATVRLSPRLDSARAVPQRPPAPVRPDVRRRLHGPEPLRGRLPARRRPRLAPTARAPPSRSSSPT